jgi:gliding motility-associated-like protein
MGISKKQFQSTFSLWLVAFFSVFAILAFTPTQTRIFVDPPRALDDAFIAYRNTQIDLPILDNDTLNGNLISPLSIIEPPVHGTAYFNTNVITYTSYPDFCGGNDTLRYVICNSAGCDTATVIIYVNCTSDNTNANQPIAVDDAISIKRNTFHVFEPTLNDVTKGDLSSVSIVKSGNKGEIGFVGVKTMVYMPQMGFCGPDTVTYRICNTLFLCDTASIFINIECTQDSIVLTKLPEAVDDETTTLENQKVAISVLANDSANGIMIAPLSIVRFPNNGLASVSMNSIHYTPTGGFCNAFDTISYKICNGLGCDTGLIVVRVNCETNPRVDDPIATNDYISTDRNKTIIFKPTLNDTINGTLLAVGFVIAPQHGAIRAASTIDSLVYTPDLNYCGYDTMVYRICRDDFKCDTAFVFFTLNCTPLGDRPNAKNDGATTLKNKPVTVPILNNDALNGALNTPLSILTPAKHGTVNFDASNAAIYTPETNFCGEKDTFSYKICNIDGCDTAIVVIDILCKNPNRPIAKGDAAIILNGKTVEINLLANDTLNGFLDSIKILTYPKNAIAALQNNAVFYTANLNFCGYYDTLSYEICTTGGCDTAQLVVSVLCDTVKIVPPPVALNDFLETMQGRTISINVLKNDSLFLEPFESLMVPILPNQGIVTIDTAQNIVYTPKLSFCGDNDTLYYRICTRSGCNTARVVIKIACDIAVNSPPIAIDDKAYTQSRVDVMIPILANDTLRGADTVRIIRFAKRGTASFDAFSNHIFYQPNTTFCGGFDSLIYEICNFKGCDTAMVIIGIRCDSVKQALPIANYDTARLNMNTAALINILKNDTLNKYILLETSVQPKHGIVSYRADGYAYYVPISEYWGRDSFVYILCNLTGCDTAKVWIDVQEGNKMVVYNGFSPNNDGINDRLIIRGIEKYPNNEVVIYNRWGNEIFRRKSYSNDDGWRGDWQGQIAMDGTYFYAVYYNDVKNQVKTGYIQLHR